MDGFRGALSLIAETLAKVIAPKPPIPFHEWLQKNIILVDGPKRGELWSPEDGPYLVEIAKCLSIEDPCNEVSVRKAQQTGVSILGLSWCLYLAEIAPENLLYAVPGKETLQEINSLKLQPLIDEWSKETGKQIVEPITSRSGKGSTTYEKKFSGGSLSLANANSEMDLSAKTIKYGVKDEVSKWEETPNGDDPEKLFFGRFTAFRRQRTYKIFSLSTPEHDSGDENGEAPGHCRIDQAFKRSDQRYWNIKCPDCAFEQVQSFSGFHVNRENPDESYYLCENCGHEITEVERVIAVRGGRFVATCPGPDRHPGFHVDAFVSLMMSYGDIARDHIATEKKGEADQKNFSNLVLALPYAMRGNAPKHERLMERREQLKRYHVPADGLLLCCGADVQHDGIYLETVAYGEDRQSWTVDADFIAGATDDPKSGAWSLLDAYHRRSFTDAWGQERRLDAMAVDGGDAGRMTQVLEWTRARPDTYAVKGQGGRGVPAISMPQNKSVNKRGKRKKVAGSKLWPVGTWGLKHEFYGSLHKPGMAAGASVDPPGYCHFADWLIEEYFKQITAEYFDQKLKKGRLKEEWVRSRKDNHYLDCRVYSMAMAEHLGLSRLTPLEWSLLRKRLQPETDPDLFLPESQKVEQQSAAADQPEPTQRENKPSSNWRTKWLNR